MRCPNCGGPDGIMMFRHVGPCVKCEREDQESRRPQAAFLTSADLGVKSEEKFVRFMPLTKKIKLPPGAVDFAFGFGGPAQALAAARDLNSGKTEKKKWGWAGLAYFRSDGDGGDAILDMGLDQKNWVPVPDGEDWGQKK